MQRRSKVVGVGVVMLVGGAIAATAVARSRDQGAQVRTEVVERRDLVELVTASGNVRARRTVDMSSDVSAKVAELLVREGEDVVAGQTLLRLEPDQYRAALSSAEAQLAQARSQEAQQRANLIRAERDMDRLERMRQRDSLLVSPQQLDDARTNVEVAQATFESAQHGVAQAEAAVEEAADRLSKTVFTAPMTGRVTRLNVEEGETVMIGTMNNPGSLVLTISDLSVMEAVIRVDETDVPRISLGDTASIRIDAFPNRTFTGSVTEIGNSAITPPDQQTGGQEAAIDFEVVLTLDETEVALRPDLSATADIVVATRRDAVSIPIIALTVRPAGTAGTAEGGGEGESTPGEDVEGVFLVSDARARFTPVEVGIAGREHFEVSSGVEVGDTVVAGPYQAIRALEHDDPIRRTNGQGFPPDDE
ncbi:MAG: efflux RND transporter periplasmic adaptor subunit [Gemmatimonadota bacterium]|nr:efflux RND transporter periplasmic adaptor subunit [Gemmatimonadota bacterium]